MSAWKATDEHVFGLPSGRLVRGRGLRSHPDLTPDPDFGLYLLATEVKGVPWPHGWVEWTDFGLPVDPHTADRAIIDAWRRTASERVEVACIGGLGRTGTALACFATLDGLRPEAAIQHIRTAYGAAAVETGEQAHYVSQFAARHG